VQNENSSIYAQTQQINQQTIQREQQRQHEADFDAIEKCFAEDKDFKDVFGEGPGRQLDPATRAKRVEVAEMVDAIRDMDLAKGRRVRSIESAYKQARAALHSDRIAKQVESGISDRVRAANGQFMSRATAVTREGSDLPHGKERAIAELTDLMRSQGRMG
jgi:hypothetical protein